MNGSWTPLAKSGIIQLSFRQGIRGSKKIAWLWSKTLCKLTRRTANVGVIALLTLHEALAFVGVHETSE